MTKLHSDEHGTIEYKKLPVEDGDVIVVKAGISQDAIDKLADMLGITGRDRSIIVAVQKLSDIRSLSPEIMANYGWYQADRLKITKKYLESKILEEDEKGGDLAPLYNGIYYVLTGRYYDRAVGGE